MADKLDEHQLQSFQQQEQQEQQEHHQQHQQQQQQERHQTASIRTNKTQNTGLQWDSNFVDTLLWLVTPIILVIVAVLLLFAAPSERVSKKEIVCRFPDTFTNSWINYGHAICLSEDAKLYRPNLESIPSNSDADADKIELATLFPTVKAAEFYLPFQRLILLAVLCLAPVVLWSLVIGNFDGSEFISNTSDEPNGFLKNSTLFLWFVITKVGSIVVCAVLLLNVMSIQTDSRIRETVNKYQPHEAQSAIVLCDYRIRRLGSNTHKYIVQCVVSQAASVQTKDFYDYILDPLLKSLLIWIIGLVIVMVVNAVCNLILSLMCLFKSYRIYFIRSKVGKQEASKYNAVDYGLGVSGVMVATLATRNGRGYQVRALLRHLCEELQDS